MGKSSPTEVYKELLKSETVSLVIEHELHGVTPEMLDWWWDNMDNDSYKLWNPKDHIALEWQIPPRQMGHIGAIHMACESISDIPPQILRIRWQDPSARSLPPFTVMSMWAVPLLPGLTTLRSAASSMNMKRHLTGHECAPHLFCPRLYSILP